MNTDVLVEEKRKIGVLFCDISLSLSFSHAHTHTHSQRERVIDKAQ